MTWVKICGITSFEDGLKASLLGVDALGFIFAPSPRRIDPHLARKIIEGLPTPPIKIGVFVDEAKEEVLRVAKYCCLDGLQFHGRESKEYCQKFNYFIIKAIRIQDVKSLSEMEMYPDTMILLDSFSPNQAGGTGNPFSWDIALGLKGKRDFILSGGLTPQNVREAIKKVKPWGVDVCSGVEASLGRKDHLKMENFIKEVKKADEDTR
ncbi:MAG: phosphoribosylanthranilate isomerase [Thermodesulfobacteriota bacterium]